MLCCNNSARQSQSVSRRRHVARPNTNDTRSPVFSKQGWTIRTGQTRIGCLPASGHCLQNKTLKVRKMIFLCSDLFGLEEPIKKKKTQTISDVTQKENCDQVSPKPNEPLEENEKRCWFVWLAMTGPPQEHGAWLYLTLCEPDRTYFTLKLLSHTKWFLAHTGLGKRQSDHPA